MDLGYVSDLTSRFNSILRPPLVVVGQDSQSYYANRVVGMSAAELGAQPVQRPVSIETYLSTIVLLVRYV